MCEWNEYKLTNLYTPTPCTFEKGKVVACAPFPSMTVEKEIRNGVAMVKQKGTTTALEVVFQSGNLAPGTKILVRSESFAHGWAKEIFTYNGVNFILVPEEFVLLVDTGPGVSNSPGYSITTLPCVTLTGGSNV